MADRLHRGVVALRAEGVWGATGPGDGAPALARGHPHLAVRPGEGRLEVEAAGAASLRARGDRRDGRRGTRPRGGGPAPARLVVPRWLVLLGCLGALAGCGGVRHGASTEIQLPTAGRRAAPRPVPATRAGPARGARRPPAGGIAPPRIIARP